MLDKKLSRCSLLLALFLILTFIFSRTGFAGYNLTILHTNDLHSHIGRFSRLATVIDKIKEMKAKEGQPVLLLDSGDFMMGTLYHLLTPTYSPELTLMDTLGYDATTFGNHEFDWGPETLANIISIARENGEGRMVPIIASNIRFNVFDTRDDALKKLYEEGVVRPYVVKTLSNGLKVGIIGLLGKNAQQEAPGAPPVGFVHNIDFIQQKVDMVKKRGAKLIICLSHSTLEEDKKLARLTEGIDIIISGHSHTALSQPIRVGNTLILEADSYARYLGKLQVSLVEGKARMRSYQLIPIEDAIPEDRSIKEVVKTYTDLINKEILGPRGLWFNSTLAGTDFDLIGEDENMLESNLGDLVTDAIRFAIDSVETGDSVDFAFYPAGFLRGNINKGEITTSDAFRVVCLGGGPGEIGGYPLVSFYLNGQEIKRILELSVFLAWKRRKEYLLQVSGLRFWYNPLRPNFKKVTRIKKQNPATGEYTYLDTSDTETLYKVGTNLFLLKLSFMTRYLPHLAIVPKDRNGTPLSPDILAGKTEALVDKKPAIPSLQEFKEWEALVSYISCFPDLNGDLIPDVPSPYAEPQARINLDSDEILRYYSRKKDPLTGIGAALLFPSLGHIYANNWYPEGFIFLLMELSSFFVASQESTKTAGLFLLASFKILECKYAYESVIDYNKTLEEALKITFSLKKARASLTLSCKF